jgi:hypothetical protein
LEGIPKYLEEADAVLKKESLSKKEKIKIKRYKTIMLFFKIITNIVNKVINKYRKIELGIMPNIYFNRNTQEFEIK